MSTERDIQFSLKLDQLAASIQAAEAALHDLRMQYEELQALHRAHVDDEHPALAKGEWLGHELVEKATELLRGSTLTP
jgi:multidrug resistance efflux pump